MTRFRWLALVAGAALTLAMLLYPPYQIALTGRHLGYYFALEPPALVEAFGALNTGRLLLQLLAVWTATAVAMLLRAPDH